VEPSNGRRPPPWDHRQRLAPSLDVARLNNYLIYAEPLVGLAVPGDFSDSLDSLCSSGACSPPAVDTNFNPRIRPAGP
jgi:hypothetical protein